MRKSAWHQPTSWDTVVRRAGGRRHVNSVRQFQATLRRQRLLVLLHEVGWRYGMGTTLAARLGVSAATISRDLAKVVPLFKECAHCGSLVPRNLAGE